MIPLPVNVHQENHSLIAAQIDERVRHIGAVGRRITHAQLAIEAGAHFEGRSLKFETPKTVEPLAISAAE